MKIASLSLLQKTKSKPLRHGDTKIRKSSVTSCLRGSNPERITTFSSFGVNFLHGWEAQKISHFSRTKLFADKKLPRQRGSFFPGDVDGLDSSKSWFVMIPASQLRQLLIQN